MNTPPKAYLLCGKICSGKSTFAEVLRRRINAVILSCDALTFALFDGNLGDAHDAMSARIHRYLYQKSLDILETGTNVILEWGFWHREERLCAREFFAKQGYECVLYYIYVTDDVWQRNIAQRNHAVRSGNVTDAYLLDDGLMQKLLSAFEEPHPSEIDIYYNVQTQEEYICPES